MLATRPAPATTIRARPRKIKSHFIGDSFAAPRSKGVNLSEWRRRKGEIVPRAAQDERAKRAEPAGSPSVRAQLLAAPPLLPERRRGEQGRVILAAGRVGDAFLGEAGLGRAGEL